MGIASSLPETHRLTGRNLWELLEKYGKVIVKPIRGRLGRHVLQVSLVDEDLYEIHHENRRITLTGRAKTYSHIQKKHLALPCLVQQKISLATIDGCPFDLRVMVQRKKQSSKWVITGKMARVAQKGYIITNVIQSILPVDTAIQNSILKGNPVENSLPATIDMISLRAARRFTAFYPKCRIIGFDLGIDQSGKVWILEANFHPMLFFFRWLEDKTMYRRIINTKKVKTRQGFIECDY